VSKGVLPVLVWRVSATVEAPMLEGVRYRLLDWRLRQIRAGTVKGGVLKLRAEDPVYLVEFVRGP